MRPVYSVVLFIGFVALAACAGLSHSTAPSGLGLVAGSSTVPGQTQVRVTFTIPGDGAVIQSNSRAPLSANPCATSAPVSTVRAPQFVSRSICSAVASALQNPGPAYTPVASVTLDLSPSSPNCTTNGNGSRSCSVFFPAPNGTDEFELDTYDVPASQLRPPTSTGRAPQFLTIAHELSSGISSPVPVTPGSAISVTLNLQGIVAGFTVPGSAPFQNSFPSPTATPTLPPAAVSRLPQSARAPLTPVTPTPVLPNVAYVQSAVGGVASSVVVQSVTPAINADDGAGNPITGATAGCPPQDQFANPIAALLSEPEGSGGSTIQIAPCNGAFGATTSSGTLSFPLDLLKVNYGGGGSAGTGFGIVRATPAPPYVAVVTGTPPVFPSPPPAILTNITTNPGRIQFMVAPLFAYLIDADGTIRTSSGAVAVAAHLAGPGSPIARLYATQYLPPSTGFNGYTATPSAGCSSGGQSVVTVGTNYAQTYGMGWPLTPGNLSSGNPSTCTITLSDGLNSVPVTIFNSVAGGNGATITIGPSPTPTATPNR
jgi:hypothetical protein